MNARFLKLWLSALLMQSGGYTHRESPDNPSGSKSVKEIFYQLTEVGFNTEWGA